jgi:hypothetical protein
MVNRSRGLSALVLAALLAGAALTAAAADRSATPKPPDSLRWGAAVKIEPAASRPGAFVCKLKVTDLASGQVLSEPQVLFLQGQKAVTRTGIQSDAGTQQEILLTVEVNQDATTATYELAVDRGGQRISTQQATVTLR